MSDSTIAKKFIISAPLQERVGEEQTGRIKVGSQIIKQLSKGIYSTPEMALKELISNAFDADARKVIIDSKSIPNAITIWDNGHGMDYKDFDENFVYISKSPKMESSGLTEKYNRPIIGRLGIGFIAVSTLCNTMVISSTKKDSKTKFVATLDFSKFKKKEKQFSDFHEISEFTLTNYEKNKEKEESYTYIELRDLEPPFRDVLLNKPEEGANARNIKNPNFENIIKKIWSTTQHLEIGKTYGPYWKFVINLASIIPVEYLSGGPIKDKKYLSVIRPFKERVEKLKFQVIFDKMELKKPYLLPTINAETTGYYDILPLTGKVEVEGRGNVSYDGYVYSQSSNIYVDDWRGLIVRVKNTSIGTTSQNFLDYPQPGDSLYFKWTFGEIYVTEGLDDAMNIDRANFKKSDPEYGKFVKELHRQLQEVVFNSVQTRWRQKVDKENKEIENYKEIWRKNTLKKVFNRTFKFEENAELKDKPVSISIKNKTVTINPDYDVYQKFPRKEGQLLKDILFAIAVSQEKYPNNIKKQEELLLEIIHNLAERYPKPSLKFKYHRIKQN